MGNLHTYKVGARITLYLRKAKGKKELGFQNLRAAKR
jgi:hypothetical protein